MSYPGSPPYAPAMPAPAAPPPWAGESFRAVAVPPLEVPAEPKPEPESASVRMLRGLLDSRKAERDQAQRRLEDGRERLRSIEDTARRQREENANAETHLSLLDVAIAEVSDDIAALGATGTLQL